VQRKTANHCPAGLFRPLKVCNISKTKHKEGGGVGRMVLRSDFSRKYVKILDVKTSFIDIMSEVQKDSEDVSAGLGIIF
jgi:hypothetical protein